MKNEIEKLRCEIDKLFVGFVSVNNTIKIDFEYIKEQIKKSENKIQSSDYDGAMTNARSLLESVLLFIMSGLNLNTDNCKGNLPKMYKILANKLDLNHTTCIDASLRQLLSGCFSIIDALSCIRNKTSDAHGKEKIKYYKPELRYAKLYVNIIRSLCEFILEVHQTREDRIKN